MKTLTFLIVITINISFVFCRNVNNDLAKESISSDTSTTKMSSDSVNISQIVLAQINAAREKDQNESLIVAKNNSNVALINPTQNPPSFISELERQLSISPDLFLKILILAIASFLATLIIIIRRKKSRKLIHSDNSLKGNIKLMREENIRIQGNSKLSSVRNRLSEKTPEYNLTSESISNSAKRLNISKDEILLAQRLKRMR